MAGVRRCAQASEPTRCEEGVQGWYEHSGTCAVVPEVVGRNPKKKRKKKEKEKRTWHRTCASGTTGSGPNAALHE